MEFPQGAPRVMERGLLTPAYAGGRAARKSMYGRDGRAPDRTEGGSTMNLGHAVGDLAATDLSDMPTTWLAYCWAYRPT
jgi:hypothetical protein